MLFDATCRQFAYANALFYLTQVSKLNWGELIWHHRRIVQQNCPRYPRDDNLVITLSSTVLLYSKPLDRAQALLHILTYFHWWSRVAKHQTMILHFPFEKNTTPKYILFTMACLEYLQRIKSKKNICSCWGVSRVAP